MIPLDHPVLDPLGRLRLDVPLPADARALDALMDRVLGPDRRFPGDAQPWCGSLTRTVVACVPEAGHDVVRLAGRTFEAVNLTPRDAPGLRGLLVFFLDLLAQAAMHGSLGHRGHVHFERQILRRSWGAYSVYLFEHAGVPVAMFCGGMHRATLPLSIVRRVAPRARERLVFLGEDGAPRPWDRARSVLVPFVMGHSAFSTVRRGGLGLVNGYEAGRIIARTLRELGVETPVLDEHGTLDVTDERWYYVTHSDKVAALHANEVLMSPVAGSLPRERITAAPYPSPLRAPGVDASALWDRVGARVGFRPMTLRVGDTVSGPEADYHPGYVPQDMQQALFLAAFEAITPEDERMAGLFDVRAGVDRSYATKETAYAAETLPDGRTFRVVPEVERRLRTGRKLEALLGDRLGDRGVYLAGTYRRRAYALLAVYLKLRYGYQRDERRPCRSLPRAIARALGAQAAPTDTVSRAASRVEEARHGL